MSGLKITLRLLGGLFIIILNAQIEQNPFTRHGKASVLDG
ncbi:MAG: hypothetical protein Kow0042_07750 [Calditrichia bacterium]